MCGIIGYTGFEQAAPIILDGLTKIEYRGYDSAGIAINANGKINLVKTVGRVQALYDRTHDGKDMPGVCGIGHTRWGTHGAISERNAHPHMSQNGKFILAHNGIVENYTRLKADLLAKGVVFKSDTDTEVVVQLLEANYTGDFKEAVIKTVAMLEGTFALMITCADYPGTLYAVKQNAPVILGLGEKENLVASDVTCLISRTKNVIYMEDGEMAEITTEGIKLFDFAGNPKEYEVKTVDWDIASSEKGGYEHFMIKEIFEQPQAVRSAISPRIKDGKINFGEKSLTAEDLKKFNRIIITACGSAYYAGLAGKFAIEKLCGIPVQTELASELRYNESGCIDEHTLVIAVSQSGETLDTLSAIKDCKACGATVMSIVNVVESSIARASDFVAYTYAGPEIAVATTKGYSTQVAVLYLFAVYTAAALGRINSGEYTKLVSEINAIPEKMETCIEMNGGIECMTPLFDKAEHVFFIGRNTDWAVAMEGALKLKEISYIHAEAYAAGEMKHGTISLIEEGTPVIAVCSNMRLQDKTASNIIEVKARGAEVTMVGPKGCESEKQANHCIYIPEMRDVFAEIVTVIPLQMLAYYVAKARGCDIDKPRNLAKSVTVE
ncbi:MAG: glutamine--fructose-6-phosphate transaminase (isomerizing) [Clostridia bacterium]|nr:glutamine--fructose-6-phosphate transaminase (isomerizing) [Clostridia bacterium]